MREDLWKKNFILVIKGDEITGFAQGSDTNLHKELKKQYRKAESTKMLKELEEDTTKIPFSKPCGYGKYGKNSKGDI